MLVILKLLAPSLIEAAVSAFGKVVLDLLQSFMANRDAKALGHAQATQAAARAADAASARMDEVMPLSDDEITRRLREGKA